MNILDTTVKTTQTAEGRTMRIVTFSAESGECVEVRMTNAVEDQREAVAKARALMIQVAVMTSSVAEASEDGDASI